MEGEQNQAEVPCHVICEDDWEDVLFFFFFFGWSLDDISRTNTNNTLDHLARRQIINTLPTKPPPKYCLRQIFSSSRLTRVTALALGM